MNMRFYIYSCTLICMKRSEAIDQLREMDAKYSCYVYCKNELAVVLGEQGQKLNRTLSSLVSAKALVRAARGVYVFAYSSHLGEGTLHQVAKRLRSCASSESGLRMSALHTGTGKPVNDRNRRIEYASDFYGNPGFFRGNIRSVNKSRT